MKRLWHLVILFFIFNLSVVNFSQAFNDPLANSLINDFRKYFLVYYSKAGKADFAVPEKVLADLKSLVRNSLPASSLRKEFEKIDDFFQLTLWLNQAFETKGLGVNIFISPQYGFVDCWFSQSVDKENFELSIWDSRERLQLFTFSNIFFSGQAHYFDTQIEPIQFISYGKVIFCNRDAVEEKSKQRWELLYGRYQAKAAYNPYASEKLRRQLLVSAWKELFLSAAAENDREKASAIFQKKALKLLIKTGIYHEAGHFWADKHLTASGAEENEAVALLTELCLGPLPQESLNTLLSFAWRSDWFIYKSAGQLILYDFFQLIKKGVIGDALKAKAGKEKSLLKQENILYYLRPDDIRYLAGKEFEKIIYN